ncbi:FAD-dependent oxidoreductase [Pseudonocardia humida]|uniref:ferredoxin--NADP(+) reductase n=1 Tax=Pseudonocardia humida TaxID=2800819 RepID=A0ABT0ZYL7_9PSEU|nr:FAD-dependent oxidoreductase [Pseudonocardia humida]MCO1655837.1 FAD-dependent oxidoreductase [Pseudonocardia humida]
MQQGNTGGDRRRVAVIGAGPSGLYAAAALLASGEPVSVEVLDRLPAPYGLVRYGVAPDHVKMKSVIRVLQRPFDPAEVEFLGGVRIGEGGVPLDVLREHFHAVVHATGSSLDRDLAIPGEDLPGSYGSGPFVSWYCGHPDHVGLAPRLDHPGVAVVGAGNVALDVARVLARDPEEMAATDVPDPVLDVLRASAVRDVHVLIRRAPQHVRFTPAELRQIGELSDVDVLVHDDGVLAAGVPEPEDRRQRQNLDILRRWAAEPSTGGSRRIHLRFLRSPVRLEGEDRVRAVVAERNTVSADDRISATGELESFDVGVVVRAIGYRAEPVPGLPFDERTGTVPNEGGRVVRDGQRVPGAYVTGWIKRGPTGVIGTNKSDATETVAAVLADLPSLPAPAHPEPEALRATLAAHGLRPVDWTGWLRLDSEEVRRGGLRAAERVKVADMAEMLEHARGVPAR